MNKKGDYLKSKKAYKNTLMSFNANKNKLEEESNKL